MQLFDLNSIYLESSYNPPQYQLRRCQDEFGENGLRSIAATSAAIRVQPVRSSILRQSQNQELFLSRSVSLHGLRSTDLPRKSTRHCNVPQFPQGETLSHGIPREARQVNAGRRERTSGLPHLSGLRLCAHQHGQQTLSKRRSWSGSETGYLCLGFNRHRSLPVHVPVGNVSQDEGRGQGAYITRCVGIDSDLYFRDSRKRSRRQDDGRRSYRSRLGLYDGPGLSRFRAALPYQSAISLFCHQEQKQYAASPHLFCTSGQNHRRSSRSDSYARRLQITSGLSRSVASGTVSRCQTKQAPGGSYEQLPYPGQDLRRYLSPSLAGGTVLQVDQTTSADQVVLRNISQCCQDPDMDCYQCLSSRGDYQEAIESSRQSLYNSTDFGVQSLLEKTYF